MRSPHESYRNVHRQSVRPDRAAASATLFTAAFDQTTGIGTYVAMESFEGSLCGRPGSFNFAHSATTSGSDRTAGVGRVRQNEAFDR
ncbi:DUF3224 domain-containing protein [Streptomyces griseofuscus]|uniref:DUF3224 domain-containing protein n=1 Tax=Streptomyces TaxID=1883 RepID=UPI0018F07B5F|nr:DUF3224 domain-containing protein [Streptomyces sp. CRPSP2-6A1]MBJ6998877.1 DUF3224 domain-containing protein [Streptomyces sp. CRPSP2-6A1]